jgi:hypothetical protein
LIPELIKKSRNGNLLIELTGFDMKKIEDLRVRSYNAIRKLREKIHELRDLQKAHLKTLEDLREREAFNFALFQYNPLTTVIVDRQGRIVKSNIAKRQSGDRLPPIGAIMYRDYASHHSKDMHAELMQCIETGTAKAFPEMPYQDKILSITMAPFPAGAIITTQDITDTKRAEYDRITLINELKKALDEVEQLRGLLPMCASCKKIRDDTGYWNQIEEYFEKRGQLSFSHTVCPDCMRILYPEIADKILGQSAVKQAQ